MTSLFAGTFARGGAAGAVSDGAWFRALLDVEAALARAAAATGLVPATAADAVTAACADPARLDLARVVARAADAGNPVPPLVEALREAVEPRDAVAGTDHRTRPAIIDGAESLDIQHHLTGHGGSLRHAEQYRSPDHHRCQ